MSATVEALGRCLVKGCTWQPLEHVAVDADGLAEDRLWSPVDKQLHCLRATEMPELVGLDAPRSALKALGPGRDETVHYYDRAVRASVHDGPLAHALSEAAGVPVRLARSRDQQRFIWSSPVSLLLRSELDEAGLPQDLARYRANVVVDDRGAPLHPTPGAQLRIGDLVLQVERPLDRCIVINHDPVTGRRDHSLLGRLRPGALLAHGCRVVRPGPVELGAGVQEAGGAVHDGAVTARH